MDYAKCVLWKWQPSALRKPLLVIFLVQSHRDSKCYLKCLIAIQFFVDEWGRRLNPISQPASRDERLCAWMYCVEVTNYILRRELDSTSQITFYYHKWWSHSGYDTPSRIVWLHESDVAWFTASYPSRVYTMPSPYDNSISKVIPSRWDTILCNKLWCLHPSCIVWPNLTCSISSD